MTAVQVPRSHLQGLVGAPKRIFTHDLHTTGLCLPLLDPHIWLTMPYSTIPTILGVGAAGVLLYATSAAFKDQTQFMVAKMDRDVDAFDQVSDFDKTTGKRSSISPRSVYQPLKPTYWEEVQGRWNRYVVDIMHTLRDANPLGNTNKSEKHQFVSDETQAAVLDALHTLAPHAPDAQPKIGILHRKYGDENTHYLGQGVSLR